MKDERQSLIKQFEELTNCDAYFLFTASGEQHYSLGGDFLPLFTEAIFKRKRNRRENAILVLETNGGDPTAAMAIVKQLRENYQKIFGYAFNRCFSAGTVGLFATDKIYMSSLALLTPIDLQCYMTDEANYRPVIANFNAFVDRKPDEREREFAATYPDEYLTAITTIRYSVQSLYPNFKKHCKPSWVETAWNYFNGGAGLHTAKISRTQAIKDLGMKIEAIPDEIEELLYNIINSYIEETGMLVGSLSQMEEKNAYFETVDLTYAHFVKYQEEEVEVSRVDLGDSEPDADAPQNPDKKVKVSDKFCIESGWKKE